MPPDVDLMLEFQYADLRLEKKVDFNDLVETINLHIRGDTPLNEDDILGVHPIPNRNWTQKVHIYCKDENTKDVLMQRGLDIFGKHVDLDEPGRGIHKVEIQNAPGHMPDFVIKSQLDKYGSISQFRHEVHRFKSGRKTNWTNGIRVAWMKGVKDLPPVIQVEWQRKSYDLKIWYYGQTERFCRFCRTIVPKDHVCDMAPKKRCHHCSSDKHLQQDCPLAQTCFKCGEKGHNAPECTVIPPDDTRGSVSVTASGQADATDNGKTVLENFPIFNMTPKGNVVSKHDKNTYANGAGPSQNEGKPRGRKKTRRQRKRAKVRKGSTQSQAEDTEVDAQSGEEGDSEYTTDEEEIVTDAEKEDKAGIDIKVTLPQASASLDAKDEEEVSEDSIMEVDEQPKEQVDILVVGGSNCEGLDQYLTGDTEMQVKPTVLFEGGLKLPRLANKLSECNDEMRKKVSYVIAHVGATDFPYEEGEEDEDSKVSRYMDEIIAMENMIPQADLIISGILPRRDDTQPRIIINEQIRNFNVRMRNMLHDCKKMHFVNSYNHLIDKKGVRKELYRENDPDGIHLNEDGKKVLAMSMLEEVSSIQVARRCAMSNNIQVEKAAEFGCKEEMNSSNPQSRNV